MKQLEHIEQVRVFAVLGLNEAKYPFLRFVFAVPNGGQRHPAVAAKLKAEGVRKGISDICLPFPKHTKGELLPDYYGAYIELKAGKNKATPEQKAFLEFVTNNGYAGIVANGADEALDFIEEYCGIKLRGRR